MTRRRGAGPYLGLLRRERDFRRVYLSQLVSLGGDWFAIVPLLTLLPHLTGSGLYGGLLLAVDTLVFALVAPYAGIVADRVDRRRVMVVADLVSAVLVLLLLLVRGPSTAWIALVAIGAVAAAKAFYQPTSSAALPNLVDAADLPAANVLAGASWGTMLAVGAALGGLVASLLGTDACFVLDAVSFAGSAVLTARTSRPFQAVRAERPRSTVRADLRESMDYARGEPRVLALLACKTGPGLGNGVLALFPLLATQVYGVGALGTGLLFSARGLGALIGPVALRRAATRERSLYLVLAGSMALYGFAYLGVSLSAAFGVVLVLIVVAHVGGGANWILSSYGMQTIVPDQVRGRIFSADFTAATLAVAVSQVAAGLLSQVVAPRVLIAGFAAVTLLYATTWTVATRGVRRRAAAVTPAGDGPPVPVGRTA